MGILPLILGSGTSKYMRKGQQIENDYDVFLTRIIVTKDDILRYSKEIPEYKKARLKKPIIIDIYI